ncbi:MAG TPA: hypothetical protein VFS89_02185 [Nitrosospira sp.]|nr:hypothetical protein [Nitrosospira sp.]
MSSHYDRVRNALMCSSDELASYLLSDAADAARVLLADLPDENAQAIFKHPIVAVGHALLVYFNNGAEEQFTQRRAIIEGLQAIRESVDSLAERPHCAAPTIEPQPASKQALSDYLWLQELLELAESTFSKGQYCEAKICLRRLAGV